MTEGRGAVSGGLPLVSPEARPAPLEQLQALAEPKRLWIVDRLRGGEHCVCELTEALDAGQSLLSHHLRVLKDAGLVRGRREGRWSYYSLVPETLETVERWLEALRTDGAAADGQACARRSDGEREPVATT